MSDDALAAPAAAPPVVSDAYRGYAMCLLLGIYIVNFLDRQVVNILAEPIKADLQLADWQLGLMSGLAFAVFYTLLGIPIARLAERANRPLIIAASVGAWSGFTMVCGLAQNFAQLVLARIGVGVGEAGCTPPAHSLIVDYAPKDKRSSALAFYGMGAPLGALLGMAFGGLVADAYGWRAAFLLAGVPGIVFALLAAFTLKEPRRMMARRADQLKAASATFGQTMKLLAGKRSFWFLIAASAVKSFIGYGTAPFLASFFLRNHADHVAGLAHSIGATVGFNLQSVGFLGVTLGLLAGISGALGIFSGGQLADRFGPVDARRYLYGPAIASLLCVPVIITALTVSSPSLALVLVAINAFLASIWYGPVFTATYSVVPAHMRATAAAVSLFITNLVGLGLGPVGVGLLSDLFAVNLGAAEGIRWALVCAGLGGLLAALLFWTGAKTLREDAVA